MGTPETSESWGGEEGITGEGEEAPATVVGEDPPGRLLETSESWGGTGSGVTAHGELAARITAQPPATLRYETPESVLRRADHSL